MADLLLDTHVLLWADEAPERLSPQAVAARENPANRLLASLAHRIFLSRKTPTFNNLRQL